MNVLAEKPFTDISGNRYGKLIAVEISPGMDARRGKLWRCLCDCGNVVVVPSNLLQRGQRKSCGCASKTRQEKVEEVARPTPITLRKNPDFSALNPWAR